MLTNKKTLTNGRPTARETVETLQETIECIQRLQTKIHVTVTPFARAGSNKDAAKALQEIEQVFQKLYEGFAELMGAMFVCEDVKNVHYVIYQVQPTTKSEAEKL